MSDSVRPHRRQPTRLPRPWDSPGKNTGVGSHFLLQCMEVKTESEVAQSCPTLGDPMDCSLPGSSVHGIFQARVLEWVAIAFSSFCVRHIHLWEVWAINWRSKNCSLFRKSMRFWWLSSGNQKEGLNSRQIPALPEVTWLLSSFSTLTFNQWMWGNGRGAVKEGVP